jgi:hypothetical protein
MGSIVLDYSGREQLSVPYPCVSGIVSPPVVQEELNTTPDSKHLSYLLQTLKLLIIS